MYSPLSLSPSSPLLTSLLLVVHKKKHFYISTDLMVCSYLHPSLCLSVISLSAPSICLSAPSVCPLRLSVCPLRLSVCPLRLSVCPLPLSVRSVYLSVRSLCLSTSSACLSIAPAVSLQNRVPCLVWVDAKHQNFMMRCAQPLTGTSGKVRDNVQHATSITYIHIHMEYIHTYIYTYIHTYIHTYTYMAYIHVHMEYIHTYIYTYIRTYTHIHTWHTYMYSVCNSGRWFFHCSTFCLVIAHHSLARCSKACI